MKNYLLLLLLSITISATAQQLGIRAGVNIASQSFSNNDVDAESILGYQLGINYEIDVTEKFAVRPGILYATKGSSQKFPDLSAESRFHYFEIPIDLVYDLGPFDIFAGPYLGYAFKGNVDTGNEIIDIDFKRDNVKQLDLGVNFGANIDILDRIYLGAYYSLGLSDISDDNDDILGSDESIKNKSISVFVAFRI